MKKILSGFFAVMLIFTMFFPLLASATILEEKLITNLDTSLIKSFAKSKSYFAIYMQDNSLWITDDSFLYNRSGIPKLFKIAVDVKEYQIIGTDLFYLDNKGELSNADVTSIKATAATKLYKDVKNFSVSENMPNDRFIIWNTIVKNAMMVVGSNKYGQLGKNLSEEMVAVPFSMDTDISNIFSGKDLSFYIKNGDLYAAGNNENNTIIPLDTDNKHISSYKKILSGVIYAESRGMLSAALNNKKQINVFGSVEEYNFNLPIAAIEHKIIDANAKNMVLDGFSVFVLDEKDTLVHYPSLTINASASPTQIDKNVKSIFSSAESITYIKHDNSCYQIKRTGQVEVESVKIFPVEKVFYTPMPTAEPIVRGNERFDRRSLFLLSLPVIPLILIAVLKIFNKIRQKKHRRPR